MLHYACLVIDQRPGSKHRRKMALIAGSREYAKLQFISKCRGTGFEPDLTTLREITPKEYETIMSVLTGVSPKRRA